jgi:hypothetical protein
MKDDRHGQEEEAQQTRGGNRGPGIFTNHIPPIQVGDGSLYIDLQHTLGQALDTPVSNPSRSNIYVAKGNNMDTEYADIGWIDVMIEYERHFERRYNVFPEGSNVRLKIWLAELPFNSAPGTEPNILIYGNHVPFGVSQPRTVVVEMDAALTPAKPIDREGSTTSTKPRRNNRHERTDGNFSKPFRIQKWWIADAKGVDIEDLGHQAPPSGSIDEVLGYKILIAFYGDRQR